MNLKVKKLHPDAKLPSRAKTGDAGYDIYSLESIDIKPSQTVKIRTGICVQLSHNPIIPEKIETYCIRFVERSSVGSKGIGLRAGLIDEGYIGELIVCLTNHGTTDYQILKGDKIAQFIVQKVETPHVVEVEELDTTDRGQNGFGSTGK